MHSHCTGFPEAGGEVRAPADVHLRADECRSRVADSALPRQVAAFGNR